MGTLRLHYEEKNILRPIGAFFLLKLKVTKIPIQNGPSSITFLSVGGDWFQGTSFLYARDHAWSNGKDALKSIALEKKSMFFISAFSSVPPYYSIMLETG